MQSVLKQSTAIIAADPFSARKVAMPIPEGLTITQVVAQAIANDNLPPRWSNQFFRIFVGGEEIPSAWWSRTRLKAGSHVAIVTAPQDGKGAGKVFRTLLTVAVVALTAWVGAGGLVGLLGAAFKAGSVAASLAAAGVSLIGGVIINSLAPVQSGAGSQSQAYSLQGAQNAARPNQPYPVVLGRRRVVPPLAAATWTETVGDDVYLRMLLAWHCGPCALSAIKIGETPIEAYQGVEMQHRLLPGDTFPTLYNKIVREQSLQLSLTHAIGWVQQTTQRKTTNISIDFGMPTGLTKNGSHGNEAVTVQVKVQYRATGTSTWNNAPVGSSGVVTYTENKSAPFRRNIAWDVAEGQYDIQIQRLTADDDSTSVADDIYWVALRSFADGLPVTNDNLAVTALKIKSSAQLNGVLDNLNGVVQMHAPKWNGTAFSGLGATRNPGEIANWVALGVANARPLSDRVDVAQLGAWTERCTEKGWNCDYIIDNGGTVETALQIVAGCGRGFGALWFDGKLAVAVDDVQSAPVQIFTARNVKNFTGTIAFPGALHAVNVNFADEDNGFQPATRTVFAEGYDEDSATLYETIDANGKTNAAEAFVVGWRYLNGRLLRPEVYEFDTAMQGLCVRIGQRADIGHYRMSVGICGARIKALVTDGDDNVSGLRLDEQVTMDVGKSYVLRVQSGSTIRLLPLTTVAGTGRTISLATPLEPDAAPGVGDHGMFGEAGLESLPAIVVGIATKGGKDGHITAIPYAPDLQADGGEVPAWDPLITPRALHPNVVGVHTPHLEKITNDNVISAVNQERNDRAAGDADIASDLSDFIFDTTSAFTAVNLRVDVLVERVDPLEIRVSTVEPLVDESHALIRDLQQREAKIAESVLSLSALIAKQGAQLGSTLAFQTIEITTQFTAGLNATAKKVEDLGVIVSGITSGFGDTVPVLSARVSTLESANADLYLRKAWADDLAVLDAQVNDGPTSIAAQVASNTSALALLDPGSSTATISQSAAAVRGLSLSVDKIGETIQNVISNMLTGAQRTAAALALVMTTVTAYADDNSAMARSQADLGAMLQMADANLAATVSVVNQASVDRDAALTSQVNTQQTYFGAGIDGTNTVSSKIAAEASTRSGADTTLTNSVNTLTSWFGAGIDATNTVAAKITSEAGTRASADTALASRASTLESVLTGFSGAGSVAASISSEASTRASADGTLNGLISTEAGRTDTLYAALTGLTGAGAVGAAITSEASARASADGSLADSIATISSYFGSGIDASHTVASKITAEANTRSSADLAMAGDITTIYSYFGAGIDGTATVAAKITAEANTRSSADGALSSRTSTLEAALTGLTTSGAVGAAITAESDARAAADGSLADDISTIYSYFGAGIDGSATVASKITSEATTRANADSALSDRADTLESYFGSGIDGTHTVSATISAEAGTRAAADSALSDSLNLLSTTVGGHTTTLGIYGSSIDGLKAQWGVQINTDGRVTGLVRLDSGDSNSNFVVVASNFYYYDGSVGAAPLLQISGGVVYINATLKANAVYAGTVVADNIIDTNHLIALSASETKVAPQSWNSIGTSEGALLSATPAYITLNLPTGSKSIIRFEGSYTRTGGHSPTVTLRLYRGTNASGTLLATAKSGGSGVAENETFVVSYVDTTPGLNSYFLTAQSSDANCTVNNGIYYAVCNKTG